SPGLIENNHALVLGLVSGQAKTPEEISRIVVKTTPANLPVRIGDVATVVHSVEPIYTIVSANGKRAVLLNINRQPDGNTVQVAGLGIPATVAVTCIALRAVGQGFNLMTLRGLAATVGLVIDDAIVVVENIVMHRDAGQSRAEAIRSAIREISKPLVGSTTTPIVVFLPLISITGVTGVFFRALAITVGMALLTSLALALTWTPTLSHYLIRRRR